MSKTPDYQLKASQKYHKNNLKQIKFTLNYNTELDLINYLETKPNKQGYIKSLILKDMANQENK